MYHLVTMVAGVAIEAKPFKDFELCLMAYNNMKASDGIKVQLIRNRGWHLVREKPKHNNRSPATVKRGDINSKGDILCEQPLNYRHTTR